MAGWNIPALYLACLNFLVSGPGQWECGPFLWFIAAHWLGIAVCVHHVNLKLILGLLVWEIDCLIVTVTPDGTRKFDVRHLVTKLDFSLEIT